MPAIDKRRGCLHQFFKLREIGYSPMSKTENQIVMEPFKAGTLVMCALCGQRRELWDNGLIVKLLIELDRDGNSIAVE